MSSNQFFTKDKDYSIMYEALTDVEKAMKETLVFFSDSEIHGRDIS